MVRGVVGGRDAGEGGSRAPRSRRMRSGRLERSRVRDEEKGRRGAPGGEDVLARHKVADRGPAGLTQRVGARKRVMHLPLSR